ncbi:hypothetical protein CRM22_004800 [Opisthorchis felineus]|uniref:Uncharacterized protein n=1 Tax=Opisthorchis felineus TaxID=147828 RepID=A0A4S2LUB4_OPIFE|nr:hypothetical protein CRM22_004800 [Opisthorchis felineus]
MYLSAITLTVLFSDPRYTGYEQLRSYNPTYPLLMATRLLQTSLMNSICTLVRRCSRSSPKVLREFQAILHKWPNDSCDRKLTLKQLLQQRMDEATTNRDSPWITEEELQSLIRLLSNTHRDSYKLPRGLGEASLNTGAPKIAASGADITECRRLLTNQDEYLETSVPIRQRLLDRMKRLFRRSTG